MYLCVRGIVIKPVPSQEDERSCICVSEVSLSSLYQATSSWLGTGLITIHLTHKYMTSYLPGLVQAWKRYLWHTDTWPLTFLDWYTLGRYRYQVCTKPGRWEVMYLCVSGIVIKPVPSQEDERSCICVSEVSLSSLYKYMTAHLPGLLQVW
jgi:hypothetical protein